MLGGWPGRVLTTLVNNIRRKQPAGLDSGNHPPRLRGGLRYRALAESDCPVVGAGVKPDWENYSTVIDSATGCRCLPLPLRAKVALIASRHQAYSPVPRGSFETAAPEPGRRSCCLQPR